MSDPHPPAFASWFAARCPDVPLPGARAVLELAASGATAPFIARFRGERTGNLDAGAVRRTLAAKEQFDKLVSRQAIILESIERHATLSPSLRERILATLEPDALEDLYHPYRQQKLNRALVAREAGLQPLADWIWGCGHGDETPQEGQTLELWAFTFRDEERGVRDAKAAIEGARDILVERLAGDPDLRGLVRSTYFEKGWLRATKTAKAKPQGRFEAYFSFQEAVPSLRRPANAHRYLAVRRGQAEDELQVSIGGPPDEPDFEARLVGAFEAAACSVPDSPGAEVLRHAARIAFKNDVRTAIENEVHRALKEAADVAAAQAFAEGVRRRLLEAPFGRRPVLAIDPGNRDGWRLAAVDGAGKLLAAESAPVQTDEQREAVRGVVLRLVRDHALEAVAVGSGSGGREAELLARATLREAGLLPPVALVNEAGAGAWGGSEAATAEFPELDSHARAAVSIARRFQDPLDELLKLEIRNLGLGPYPHDLPHATLQKAVQAVIEDCVSGVGVDLNAASRALLSRVAGLSPALAAAIVERREKEGPFRSRRQLRELPGLSAESFEQAVGFLRLAGEEDQPDDAPAPWPDPRGSFVPFAFREDVAKLEDLKPGMVCPGVVSHVTSFGAFVDVGVHHDGLVHVSQLGGKSGKDLTALDPGDRVEVRVLKVDLEKKQVSLSMRPPPPERRPTRSPERRPGRRPEARPAAAKAAAPSRSQPSDARPPGPPSRRPSSRPPASRPPASRPPAERRLPERRSPEPRRPAFNNPFAVLAGLKVPTKKS